MKINNIATYKKSFVVVCVFFLFTIIFIKIPIPAPDWEYVFYPVANKFKAPYTINFFLNLPWMTILLYPFRFFSTNVSLALNNSMNIIIFGMLLFKKKGKLLSIFLTLTSAPFLLLILNGNVEWIPALGFLLGNGVGAFILLAKPQSGIFAIIDWFIKSTNKKLFISIPIIGVILSLFIWENWPLKIIENINYMRGLPEGLNSWNFSLFPWSIPIGIAIILFIFYKRPSDGELLGVVATLLVTPYFTIHSLTLLFTLFSVKYPKYSVPIWMLLWGFVLKNP